MADSKQHQLSLSDRKKVDLAWHLIDFIKKQIKVPCQVTIRCIDYITRKLQRCFVRHFSASRAWQEKLSSAIDGSVPIWNQPSIG